MTITNDLAAVARPMRLSQGARRLEILPQTTSDGIDYLGFENGVLVSRDRDSARVLARLIRRTGNRHPAPLSGRLSPSK